MTTQGGTDDGRIVVGFDNSQTAEHALRWAAREARLRSAHLEIIHAWEMPTGAMPPYVAYSEEKAERHAWLILGTAATRLRAEASIDVETKAVMGNPATVLIEASRDADLLVVGTHGHGTFVGTLLGSVSQRVATHAHCPVVIVRTRH